MQDYYIQLLAILHEEELIRCRKRFEKQDNFGMAELMTRELDQREAEHKAQKKAKREEKEK